MEVGDRIQGRYRLESPLGAGGMADVWRVQDERLDRVAALKLLAPQLTGDPEFLVRFFAEAQSVARITHANVVRVLDFGENEGAPYLVMEYVPTPLTELTGQPMMPERAADIVAEAARGAGAAHDLGIVHRDIKPGNILLDDSGRAKLADFGIASHQDSERLTATGAAIGSPHYISPEQASGQSATPRSDVYSLGCVLYELLAGRPPFVSDNVTALAIAHVEQTPQRPSEVVEGLDPELDAIVMRALAKDPEQRYENGRALADALEARDAGALPLIPATDDEWDEQDWVLQSSPLKRTAVGIGIVALLVALLAGGIYAASRDNAPQPQASGEEPAIQSDGNERSRDRTPTPSPTLTQAAAVSTPTPRPTKTKEPREKNKRRNKQHDVVGHEPDPTPSPEPTPTPTPTPEPTQADPTPAPTAQDDSGDGTGDPPA